MLWHVGCIATQSLAYIDYQCSTRHQKRFLPSLLHFMSIPLPHKMIQYFPLEILTTPCPLVAFRPIQNSRQCKKGRVVSIAHRKKQGRWFDTIPDSYMDLNPASNLRSLPSFFLPRMYLLLNISKILSFYIWTFYHVCADRPHSSPRIYQIMCPPLSP